MMSAGILQSISNVPMTYVASGKEIEGYFVVGSFLIVYKNSNEEEQEIGFTIDTYRVTPFAAPLISLVDKTKPNLKYLAKLVPVFENNGFTLYYTSKFSFNEGVAIYEDDDLIIF